MENKINLRFITLLGITVLIGILRIVNTGTDSAIWGHFTPLGAMALFGGTYFGSQVKSYLFPLLILMISDVVLMQTFYAEYSSGLLYSGWYWTYGSFAAMVWIAGLFKDKVNVTSVISGSVLAALAHFIISDFGVWLGGGCDPVTGIPFSKDWQGLLNCYVAAIPYMKNMLIGNLGFGAILFGGFELAQYKFPILRKSSPSL